MANGNGMMPNNAPMDRSGTPPMAPNAMAGGDGAAMPQEGMGRDATEEEGAVYQELLGNIMAAVYEPKTAKGIASAFKSPQPVEPLAQAVSSAVAKVAYDGLEQGQPISREMAVAAAAQISEDLGLELGASRWSRAVE